MKYLKIFEDFNNEFPDVFNGTLRRVLKLIKMNILIILSHVN